MIADPSISEVGPETIYGSIRQEVLDQKKCQFQMFGSAITVTAAILAYASSMRAGPIVYVVPVLMNVLALTIVLDKAVSIQRMVGYLQLMESQESTARAGSQQGGSVHGATSHSSCFGRSAHP